MIKRRSVLGALCVAAFLSTLGFLIFPLGGATLENALNVLIGETVRPKLFYQNTRGEITMGVMKEAPPSGEGFAQVQSGAAGSAYDRIQVAVDYGRISLKEGVLLRAKLLYAPQLIPADCEFAPGPDEPIIKPGDSLTGFYKDIHRVMNDLTEDEKSWLRTLSPDLDAIVKR